MKICLLAIIFLFVIPLHAVDLPTVTIEHLYYLQARADRVRKFKPDEMIEYCLTQKIGGSGFESLYSQLFTIRVEIAKFLIVGEVSNTDPRVVSLNKNAAAYTQILQEEAQKIQNGIIREGQVATDALQAIARAQTTR